MNLAHWTNQNQEMYLFFHRMGASFFINGDVVDNYQPKLLRKKDILYLKNTLLKEEYDLYRLERISTDDQTNRGSITRFDLLPVDVRDEIRKEIANVGERESFLLIKQG